jgi:hypothetical protein
MPACTVGAELADPGGRKPTTSRLTSKSDSGKRVVGLLAFIESTLTPCTSRRRDSVEPVGYPVPDVVLVFRIVVVTEVVAKTLALDFRAVKRFPPT